MNNDKDIKFLIDFKTMYIQSISDMDLPVYKTIGSILKYINDPIPQDHICFIDILKKMNINVSSYPEFIKYMRKRIHNIIVDNGVFNYIDLIAPYNIMVI